MLSQAQIQSARQSLNITPTSGGTINRVTDFQNAVKGTSSESSPLGDIGAQFMSGLGQVKQGMSESQPVGGGGIPGLITGTGKILGGAAAMATSPLAPALKPIDEGIQAIGSKIGDIPSVQKFAMSPAGEAAATTAETVANYANAFGTVAGIEGGITSAPKAFNAVSDYLSKPVTTETAAPATTGGITDSIRSYFAKDNVDPRLQATAQRLDNPVQAYKDYASQAQSAAKDVKADPPIATVGENIGKAYDAVTNMRRTVGKQMEDALAPVRDTAVNIGSAANDFIDQLSAGIGKMTTFDKSLMGTYLKSLRQLGDNPTVGKIDDFLSRVPKELDVAKAAKNITDVTNAERIIKGSLSQIRDSLTNTPGLEAYTAARSAYSNLSNFLEQGGKYLGAKTASGDFTRDASVAKSAAESILNGGKKDWLIKLEGLTGYKALDDATLAIQAMKDAGDLRGLSLFKTIGEGAIHPTSIPFKLLQWAGSKVGKKVLGTDAQQTEAFLKSLQSSDTSPSGAATTGNLPPETAVESSTALPKSTTPSPKGK